MSIELIEKKSDKPIGQLCTVSGYAAMWELAQKHGTPLVKDFFVTGKTIFPQRVSKEILKLLPHAGGSAGNETKSAIRSASRLLAKTDKEVFVET